MCPHVQGSLPASFSGMQLLSLSRAPDILHLPALCAPSASSGSEDPERPPHCPLLLPLRPAGSTGSAEGRRMQRCIRKGFNVGSWGAVRKGEDGVSLSPQLFESGSDLRAQAPCWFPAGLRPEGRRAEPTPLSFRLHIPPARGAQPQLSFPTPPPSPAPMLFSPVLTP